MRAFALALAVGAAAAVARADDVPSNSVRVGAYYIYYNTSADDISGPFVPPGVNLKLKNTVTPYLAYVRRLTPHFSAELAFGVPPLTKTLGKGPAQLGSVPYNNQVIATSRWLAPTFLVEYSFFDESVPVRPYIGVGVNYTKFYDRQSTAAGNAVAGGPTSVSLPVSVGIAGTVGVSWHVRGPFNVYASYSASRVHSRLTLNTAGVIRTSNIEFGPRAIVLSAGYSF